MAKTSVKATVKRPRKGHRQLLTAARASTAQCVTPSPAVDKCHGGVKLLHLEALGIISSTLLGILARCFLLDVNIAIKTGRAPTMLLELASIGSFGVHLGNSARDLKQWFGKSLVMPAPERLLVPALNCKVEKGKDNVVEMILATMSTLDPHELVHMLSHRYNDVYTRCFGIRRIKAFWQAHSREDPKLDGHPMMEVRNWQTLFSPIWLFGDGADFGSHDSVTCSLFGGVLADDDLPMLLKCFLTQAFPKSSTCTFKKEKRDTWHRGWQRTAWSYNALYEGVFPWVDDMGNEFPVGSRGWTMAGTQICPQGTRFVTWHP